MKSVIAYKENGVCHLMVIGFTFFDNERICDSNSIIDCGHGIFIGTSLKTKEILPIMAAAEKIREIDDENLVVDKQFIIEFIEPCFSDYLDRQGLMNYDEGEYSFPDDFIIIQNDKMFLVHCDFDVFEIEDFITIGAYKSDLLTAHILEYKKELPMRDRIIANFKKLNKVSNDNNITGFYINTKNKVKEKFAL